MRSDGRFDNDLLDDTRLLRQIPRPAELDLHALAIQGPWSFWRSL
ncbi:hypothetical protein [Nonomuraea guangzhouensis]|uniref:Uncharacterized protein n=1 Tax=Nonomuraea guangzhouensis TaxID=1291555 RepID=A0ABW4G936_9ACTN|nr:hypothetical protein [Nonomuraea guangzhouensis]